LSETDVCRIGAYQIKAGFAGERPAGGAGAPSSVARTQPFLEGDAANLD
jgi:hypothetical protein